MNITKQIKLIKILKENKKLCELVRMLSKIKDDKNIDIEKTINDLELPINYHLFIKSNYSELMQLKFN